MPNQAYQKEVRTNTRKLQQVNAPSAQRSGPRPGGRGTGAGTGAGGAQPGDSNNMMLADDPTVQGRDTGEYLQWIYSRELCQLIGLNFIFASIRTISCRDYLQFSRALLPILQRLVSWGLCSIEHMRVGWKSEHVVNSSASTVVAAAVFICTEWLPVETRGRDATRSDPKPGD